MTRLADQVDERRVRLRSPGPHAIAALVARSAAVNPTRLQPFVRSSTDTRDTSGHPHFDLLTVTGPFNPSGPGATPSRARVFTCRPKTAAEEDPCARKIIATLARRAYRGDVTAVDQQRLLAFYQDGCRKGNFERASRRRFKAFSPARNSRFTSSATCRRSRPARARITRSRARVRLSFFPVEQHSRRSADRPRARGATHAGRLGRAGAPDAGRIPGPRRHHELRRQWPHLRNLKNMQPNSSAPISTTTRGRRSSAKPRSSSTASCVKTATCSI